MRNLTVVRKANFSDGFSLIEVAMALAIMAFASISLIGLIPFGLASFHQAMSNTVESQIVQNLSNDLLLANFSDLYQYNGNNYYYDNEGSPLSSSAGAIYTATVSMSGVDTANSPAALKNSGVSTAATTQNTSAYSVTITLSNVSQPAQSHTYNVIIANNNL